MKMLHSVKVNLGQTSEISSLASNKHIHTCSINRDTKTNEHEDEWKLM